MKEKDLSVELLRIIGMIIVLGCHVNTGMTYNDIVNPIGVGITCIVADGVAVFWMIMGFFLFNSEYKRLLRRACKRVLIPMFVFSALMFYFGEFFAGNNVNILYGFTKPLSEYKNLLFNGLLKWRTVVPYTAHFWYLYSYMIVILAFPAIKGIVTAAKEKKRMIILFSVLFGLLLINDIEMNGLIKLSHEPFAGAFGGVFLVLLGYLIYSIKDIYENKPIYGVFGLISFIIVNIIRSVIQYKVALQGGSNHLVYWYTTFGVLSAYSLIVFVFGIKKVINKRIVKDVIKHIGSLSMWVYLIHLLVLARLINMGVMDKITSLLTGSPSSIIKVQILKTAVLLIGSLFVVEIIYWIKRIIVFAMNKAVHR